MTKVFCYLEECALCVDNICTAREIVLDEEHISYGGCDNGFMARGDEVEE